MIALILLAALIGFLLTVQAGVNAQLGRVIGDPISTAFISFLVGTVGLGLLALALKTPMPLVTAWQRSAWWYWTAGFLGAIYISAAVVLAPRLGAATLIAAVVGGQMVAAVLLDHYGWVGFAQHPVSGARLLGAVLIMVGVVLIRK